MFTFMRIDDRFLDRHGCGDELYCDSRLKAALCIASLRGLEESDDAELDVELDLEFASLAADDVARG